MEQEIKEKPFRICIGVLDRFRIIGMLPEKGYMSEMGIAESIKKKVLPDQSILEKVDFFEGNGKIQVDKEKDIDNKTIIDFEQHEIDFLKKQVNNMDSDKNITIDLLPVCRLILDLKK